MVPSNRVEKGCTQVEIVFATRRFRVRVENEKRAKFQDDAKELAKNAQEAGESVIRYFVLS